MILFVHFLSPVGNDIMRKSSLEGNYLASYKRDALKFRVIKLIYFTGCTAACLTGEWKCLDPWLQSHWNWDSSTSTLGLTVQLAGFYHSLRDKYCLRTSIWMTLFPVHVPFLAHTPGYVGPGTRWGVPRGAHMCCRGSSPQNTAKRSGPLGLRRLFYRVGGEEPHACLDRSVLLLSRGKKKRQSWNKHFILIIVLFFVVSPVPSWIR